MGSMAKPQERCPCEGEDDCPAGAPGKVEDGEVVIRFVPTRDDLEWNEDGEVFLRPTIFSHDELEKKRGKSASLLRGTLTEPEEVTRRARERGRNGNWPTDPVLARAVTSELRAYCDPTGRREACVHADPLKDQLGDCPTHALVRRADPPIDPAQRARKNAFREKLALTFSDIRHASNAAVVPPADMPD